MSDARYFTLYPQVTRDELRTAVRAALEAGNLTDLQSRALATAALFTPHGALSSVATKADGPADQALWVLAPRLGRTIIDLGDPENIFQGDVWFRRTPAPRTTYEMGRGEKLCATYVFTEGPAQRLKFTEGPVWRDVPVAVNGQHNIFIAMLAEDGDRYFRALTPEAKARVGSMMADARLGWGAYMTLNAVKEYGDVVRSFIRQDEDEEEAREARAVRKKEIRSHAKQASFVRSALEGSLNLAVRPQSIKELLDAKRKELEALEQEIVSAGLDPRDLKKGGRKIEAGLATQLEAFEKDLVEAEEAVAALRRPYMKSRGMSPGTPTNVAESEPKPAAPTEPVAPSEPVTKESMEAFIKEKQREIAEQIVALIHKERTDRPDGVSDQAWFAALLGCQERANVATHLPGKRLDLFRYFVLQARSNPPPLPRTKYGRAR